MRGIYREAGLWQCLDCLSNGTDADEADEGIQHYARCPALMECQVSGTPCKWPYCICPVDIVTNPRGPSKTALKSR